MQDIAVFWFRRDLRLSDNVGLAAAHNSGLPVLPIFIFDKNILDDLESDDPRVSFIHEQLVDLQRIITTEGGDVLTIHSTPEEAFKLIGEQYQIKQIHTNRDYEPYAIKRDKAINTWCDNNQIEFITHKDQVINEPGDVLKDEGNPYTVYTPFKNKWLKLTKPSTIKAQEMPNFNWFNHTGKFHTLSELGFEASEIKVLDFNLESITDYPNTRNFPAVDGTSNLSPHLRFGTIGIRELIEKVHKLEVFVSELIWREFFMQILYYFPHVVDRNYRSKYDGIKWRNNEDDFAKWCAGKTGYPMVDAGMRQLNQTGYMHNRVRMVVASFLCKHLLIDWKWGEAYFAKKLLDYDLSANNGNWQWAAGTGCDAAPYFRVFNPSEQLKKFDPKMTYVKRWVPEVLQLSYARPMVEHSFARKRAIDTYKEGIDQ